jgi:site-specific DNA recombinase
VIVYLRISFDQHRDRRGVIVQAQDAEAWVQAHGGTLVWDALEKAENNTSAFKKKRVRVPDGENGWRWALRVVRPRWEEALRMIREGEADTLLVVNQDRMVREPRDLEDAIELVEDFGALVLDVGGDLDLTTDQGVFIARMMVAHANLSSRDTSRRLKRRYRADAEAGKPHPTGRPFGYARGGMEVVEAEAVEIRSAAGRLLEGASCFTIVRDWNTRGMVTSCGKPWTVRTFRDVLTNPRMAGLSSSRVWDENGSTAARRSQRWEIRRHADGTEVKGNWPAILPRSTWEAVCGRIEEIRLMAGPVTARNTRRYLLSGLLRCGLCGGPMYGQTHSKNGHVNYRCQGGRLTGLERCGGVTGRAGELDLHVTAAALARYEMALAELGAVQAAEAEQWAGMADLERVERKLAAVHARWKEDKVSDDDYFALREELEGDRVRMRRELAAWESSPERSAGRAVLSVDVRALWDKAEEDGGWSLQAKREFLTQHLRAVRLGPVPVDATTGRRRYKTDVTSRVTLVWRGERAGAGPDGVGGSAGRGVEASTAA